MEWLELLYQILEVCIIPLLGVLTAYFVKFIKVKSQEIQSKVDSDLGDKYIEMLSDTISACVIATNQTYVEALKKEGAFSKENQKEALQKTYDEVLNILSDDAKEYLKEACGDLECQIKTKIEAKVKESKQ